MIAFKGQNLEWAFDVQLHPAVRGLVTELDRFVTRMKYAPLVVTAVCRSPEEMAAIYGRDWRGKGRWSWHLVNRAVDLRNRDWTDAQRHAIETWLKKQWPDAEILMHDIGRGDHLHVAIPGPRSRLRRLRRWVTRRKNVA